MENIIDQEGLRQLEHLLAQSMKGIHILFENDVIAEVMRETDKKKNFSMKQLKDIQELLAKFIEQKSFDDKKNFLSRLDKKSHDLLLRTYFSILENSIKEGKNIH